MSNVEKPDSVKMRELFILFVLCVHEISGKTRPGNVNGLSRTEDILNAILSESKKIKTKNPQEYLDISTSNPWTEESLNTRRTTFTKEEIDKIKVDDYNVEVLLESMSLGAGGTVLKPRGMRPDQSVGAQLVKSEMMYSSALENMFPNKPANINYRKKRTFIPRYEKYLHLWPNGVVPYVISRNTFTDPTIESSIKLAINLVMERTCIRFIETSLLEAVDKYDYNVVLIGNFWGPGSGCGSLVGPYPLPMESFKNKINLDDTKWYCKIVGTILHELGHSLGMQHEFVRPDRDDHVTIHWDRIPPSIPLRNFRITNTKLRTPFDYASTMQYQLQGPTKIFPQQTLTLRDPELNFLMGIGKPLSYYDEMNIIKAYKCYDGCPIKTCSNGGVRNQTCQCICPDGLTGPDCNQVINEGICGGIIDVREDSEVVLESPDFNTTFPPGGAKCYWLLKAQPGYAIMIEIDELSLSWNNESRRCYHWLEIAYNLVGQPGPKYCGDSFPKGKVTTSRYGEPDLMMLKLDTESVSGIEQIGGFRLRARAYDVYSTDENGPNAAGCLLPPTVANATNNVADVGRKYGAIVSYECVGDHTMFGESSYITCHADGTWTNILFYCELREPIYSCDFSSDDCNIINLSGPGDAYSWKRFQVNEESFLRIDPSLNQDQSAYKLVNFAINFTLHEFTEYCIEISFYRPIERSPCTSFFVTLQSDLNNINSNALTIIGSWYCFNEGWVNAKSSYTTDVTGLLYIETETNANEAFNLDFDNIVIREGRCVLDFTNY